MIGQFEELLHELGQMFELELHVDRHNACSLQVHGRITIQLQLDASQENLWIFSKIIETPSGAFRENILKEALKSNALADPRAGIFGYLLSANQLVLFQKYPLFILNGERLSGCVGAFLEMAESWQEAIARGESAPLNQRRENPPLGFP